MQLNDVDKSICKQYALLRQCFPNRAIDYDRKRRTCYIQEQEFFLAGNTTSDADFIHFEL
eukprot:Awhi_evm2s15800